MQQRPTDGGNVVRLFFDESDLEEAWQRFDVGMKRLHELYDDPEASELDRRMAALESAAAEVHFRAVYARVPATKLMRA